MHETCCRDHLAAESLGDGLMPQTNTQNRNLSGKLMNDRHGDSGCIRTAGTRRNDDCRRLHIGKGIDSDGVVSIYPYIRNQLPEILNQVISE